MIQGINNSKFISGSMNCTHHHIITAASYRKRPACQMCAVTLQRSAVAGWRALLLLLLLSQGPCCLSGVCRVIICLPAALFSPRA